MSQTGVSAWTQTAPQSRGLPLTANVTGQDVCVIGAGIAGLTTAYLLARAGLKVAVVEAQHTIAPGETAYTTAHLSCVLDDRFSEVERCRGEEIMRLAVESHAQAIDRIGRIAAEEGIDCDYRRVDGYLFLGPGDPEGLLAGEEDAARRAGLACERLASAPLPERTRSCLRFPNQGQFHPLKYLAGLHRAIERLGGLVFTDSPVAQILPGEPCQVMTRSNRAVTASSVVVATNTPVNDVVALHTKQAPYKTYAFAAEVPAGHVPTALYWDTEDPYHYVRTQPHSEPGKELLIIGGADHKTGQHTDPHTNWERIERWGRTHCPQMGEVLWRWSGQVMETLDGLAFIGRDPGGMKDVYIATGDSGMGMTHGTIAGMLLSDVLTGRDNRYAPVYDPARTPLTAVGDFLEENANVALQYLDWVTDGDVSSVDRIPSGKGAIVRRGLTKLALYRDKDGHLHRCSAVCPHLGCIVRWNDAEKTWDCPCHGSRFSAEGRVIHGPALSDLDRS